MIQQKGGRAAILFILLGGLGVGSLAYYVKTTPGAARVPEAVRIEKKPKQPKVEAAVKMPKEEVVVATTRPAKTDTVRLPAFGDDIADMELAKREVEVPPGEGAMRFLAQRILDAAHFDGGRVLRVDVRDHVAIVETNAAVGRGMGSMEEGAFLRALQIGFGQFTQIDKVAIESDGEPLRSGHVDLSEPMAVIRPGGTAPEDPKPVEP